MTETQDFEQLNGIALAYMGDAIYEVYIRRHLIQAGLTKPTKLHHKATMYVSAKAQAALIDLMLEQEKLSETEQDYFRRGRNAKSYTHAKNTSVVTYRISTGFEALFGYLYLSGQTERVGELANWCIEQVEAGRLPNER
ncbi:Mini-ribonuclease 3 [Secundilactobacillus kimchicus]|uniref:Mini-ribonuclease 3 n=1 Tax=Secundilactobacillus kimchicus JCM 15530 TaxID=1302272 RepID=A0A0R1HN19_9LACO|nr:Mini-ribonuclease 3 [Secundilactobacillus kimchicus]KRK48016.1 ribonuclease III [Secundilactobacillus kimchicus JCM 15530]MBT9671020.1 Mini-ribonuclease 3 [Secundilactobacillus kimchicus]